MSHFRAIRKILNTINIVLDKKPPGRPVTDIDLYLQYEGNCNQESVKEKLKERYMTNTGAARTEVSCGMAGKGTSF